MNQPLVSLALVITVALLYLAYVLGFSVGKTTGRDEGHERGKQEGAVRAFAVGYDRGRRERDNDDDQEGATPSGDRPSLVVFVVLVLATFFALIVAQMIRQQG